MNKNLLITPVLIILYICLWYLSSLFEYAPYASLWFAPAGLAVAILLLWKKDGFIMVWLCIGLTSVQAKFIQSGMPGLPYTLMASSFLAFGFTAPYWFAINLYNKIELKIEHSEITNLLKPVLYLLFLLGGSLGAASLGIMVLISLGEITTDVGKSIWLAWWIGDFVGVIILTPLFVLIGYRYFNRWVDPRNSLLIQNSIINNQKVPIDLISWVSIVFIIVFPAIIATLRSEYDERIPIIISLFFALLPISVLAIKTSWAVIVSTIVCSSLTIIMTVKYFSILDEGFSYQTTLLAIAITAFYFYNFVKAFSLKSEELIETERSLNTASKLLTLNELSANITHELSTPLQTAMTSSQRVRRRLEKLNGDWSIEVNELNNVKLAIDQAGKTISTIRHLIKAPITNKIHCSVDNAFHTINELLASSLKKHEVTMDLCDVSNLPDIALEQNEFIQIFLNLISNSISSLKKASIREITITVEHYNEETIIFKIFDTGKVIDEAMLNKVFQLGSSETPDGLGLGLWVSRSIANRRGGSLEYVRNEPKNHFFQLKTKCIKENLK